MAEATSATPAPIGLHWPLAPRDPGEEHRSSTPLELLFDLCFVVAVAVGQAAARLHHAVGEAHVFHGLVGYAMVFFAIWWAWMNFSWFASAYDQDDVLYRLLTLMQMCGVLVLATGVDAAFNHEDFTRVTAGYVIMRIPMTLQWLRAAAGDPVRRTVALRYAGAARPEVLEGDFEIVALAGSLSADGAHLHMAIADGAGRVTGGHVCAGCRVRTTAEILLALLPGWTFARRRDAVTGYPELVIERDD